MRSKILHIPGTLLLVMLLALMVAACGNQASPPDTPEEPAASEEEAAGEEETAAEEDTAGEEDTTAEEEPASEEGTAAEEEPADNSAAQGDEVETLADIPVYEGATALEPGENTLADLTAQTMESMLAEETGAEIDFASYSLPAGTAWEDVKAFYEGQFAGDKWSYSDEISSETEDEIKMAAWTTGGGFTAEQVIMVSYIPDVMSENVALILFYLSE